MFAAVTHTVRDTASPSREASGAWRKHRLPMPTPVGILQRCAGNSYLEQQAGGSHLPQAKEGQDCACGRDAGHDERQDDLIRPSLTVSSPDDASEREADAIANQVVRGLATGLNSSNPESAGAMIQRQASEEAAPDDESAGSASNPLIGQIEALLAQDGVQAKAISGGIGVPQGVASSLNASKGGGAQLPNHVRAQMEGAFGADFGDVRVHTDAAAAQMAQEVGAYAFTHRRDIYFNRGAWDPDSSAGGQLLAHELTHTLQQGDSQIRRLAITRHKRDTLSCGGRNVQWVFALSAAAPDDGYIVQHIRALETIQPCPADVKSISLTPTLEYWEAWDVSKGDTVDWTTTRDSWTDGSTRGPENAKSGCQASLGTIKFFSRATTGDLGGFGTAPATPGSAWGPGKVPTSGALPSTPSQPSWWNDRPVEGPGNRWASSYWNCCAEPAKQHNDVDSNP